jgi:hypothetical protein
LEAKCQKGEGTKRDTTKEGGAAKNDCSDEDCVLLAEAAKVFNRTDEIPIPYVLTKKVDPKPPEAGVSLSVPAAVISDLDGAGKLLVELRNTGETAQQDLHLQITSGAFIDLDSEPPRDGADHVANKAGAYLLSLHGLRPGTPISLHAFRIQDKKPVLIGDATIQVMAATPKPEPKKKKKE